jgi:hypothetical protein
MDMIFDVCDAIATTENHIKQLHGVPLKYSAKAEEHHGECKKVPNDVQAFGPDGKSRVWCSRPRHRLQLQSG